MIKITTVACLLASLAFAGCGVLNDGEKAKSEVKFGFWKKEQDQKLPDFEVVYATNETQVVPDDIFSQVHNRVTAGPFEIAPSDSLVVTINLLKKETIKTSAQISLPGRTDWRHSVTFQIGSVDPIELCIGCVGSESFALDSTFKLQPTDSLYIVWGGKSISKPGIR
jgi:hypothetical protein